MFAGGPLPSFALVALPGPVSATYGSILYSRDGLMISKYVRSTNDNTAFVCDVFVGVTRGGTVTCQNLLASGYGGEILRNA